YARHLADAGEQGVAGGRVVDHRAADIGVAVEAQDATEQLRAEAVHHRHDDDQHGHRQGDADEGDDGDDRDAALLALGAQVTAGDRPLPAAEGPGGAEVTHAPSAFMASSSDRVWRSPVARRFSSTSPEARPLGPITSCQGRPIRSMVANLAPARSSVSSSSGSLPAFSRASWALAQAGAPAASQGFRLTMPTPKGATASGQMMPFSSWLASMMAPSRRETP